MPDTEKRLKSWGFEEVCKILKRGGRVVNNGKLTNLVQPHHRGINLIAYKQYGLSNSQRAQKEANSVINAYCQDLSCPAFNRCTPEPVGVRDHNLWYPGVRPRKQRP
ncbi:MAG TPA: hypothetical protein VI819_02630 [Patescibacteria group bacterium]|nr:hypothetical protein [Patescibacteria group bacterium]